MKRSITSTQFLQYVEVLRQEFTDTDKVTSWLRYIALEVRRVWVKDPSCVKLEDIALTFDTVKKTDVPDTEELSEARLANMKSYWFGLVGLDKPEDK